MYNNLYFENWYYDKVLNPIFICQKSAQSLWMCLLFKDIELEIPSLIIDVICPSHGLYHLQNKKASLTV